MPLVSYSSGARHFAFSLLTPPSPSPGFVLCHALEEVGGNPTFGLAASYYDALVVVFESEAVREATIARMPLSYLGHSIKLERPEHTETRFGCRRSCFAQLAATGFSLEHWSEAGIRAAFRPIGSVCCIDSLCLNELDFSVIRLVLHLEDVNDNPHALLLCDFEGETSSEVRLFVVRSWPASQDGFSHNDHYAGGGGDTPLRGATMMDDIDDESLGPLPSGSEPAPDVHNVTPTPANGATGSSAVLDFWSRVLARRAGDFQATPSTPVDLWNRMLGRRMAAQFPEAGLDADQDDDAIVPTAPAAPASDDRGHVGSALASPMNACPSLLLGTSMRPMLANAMPNVSVPLTLRSRLAAARASLPRKLRSSPIC